MQIGVKLIEDSNLTIGVNVPLNGCCSLCVGPDGEGVTRLSANVSWDWPKLRGQAV